MMSGGQDVHRCFLTMAIEKKSLAILGNVALDVICKTVDDVPRFDSISFDDSAVTPGGCASNTALNLASLNESVYIIACTGDDLTADFLFQTWQGRGVNTIFTKRVEKKQSGVSVGLVDSDLQPRFIHASGANRELTPESIEPEKLSNHGISFFYIAGYFVLPGMLTPGLDKKLYKLRQNGIFTSLDVVTSPAMGSPDVLWPVLSQLDVFLCNQREAEILSGQADPESAAIFLHEKGARKVIIKLGKDGCWLFEDEVGSLIPGEKTQKVVDTTGAGDAFAAGLLAGLRRGLTLAESCQEGNRLGAKTVSFLGAVKLE